MHPHRHSGRRLRAASCRPALVLALAAALSGCDGPTPTSEMPARTEAFPDICGAPATPIAGLPRREGAGIAEFGRVTVEGVVSAVFRDGLGGFFLQSGKGEDDGNPATPEGLFVQLDGQTDAPKRGQRVRVTGKWSRSDDRSVATWALRSPERVQSCGEAGPPPAVELREPPGDWSQLAGMYVRIPGPLVLSGNETLLRHGELAVVFGGERLYAPTELAAPGPAAREAERHNRQRSLLVDDGRKGEYPRNLWMLPRSVSAQAPYRVGSLLYGLEGVIDQRHGRWRLQLARPIARVEQAPRPQAPARSGGSVRVASFNVLNFFNGDGRGGGFPTQRGAASRELAQRQRAKLVAAMRELDADVLALMEIENDGFDEGSALAELAAALDGPRRRGRDGVWRAVRPDGADRIGRDVIAVGLLYRSDRIEPVGPALVLDEEPFGATSRVPLAQAFRALEGEARPFLVVVNHFKSKGGCAEADEANLDQGDGQACYAAARRDSAQRLAAWLGGDPAGIGAGQALVLGDLNAYRHEDPVRLLLRHGYRDLLAELDADGGHPPHSYVFQGQAGLLDHALAGPDLAGRALAAGVWSINADELPEFAYDGDARSGHRLYAPDPWRSSDHDPVWVDLRP